MNDPFSQSSVYDDYSYVDPTVTERVVYPSSGNWPSNKTTDTNVDNSDGGGATVWIVSIIIIIAVIAGVILLIWWFTSGKKDTPDNTNTGALAITGSDFKAVPPTSIQATWTSVGNAADIVRLYVNPTGKEMKFNSAGQPLGTYFSSGPVTSSARTATVAGLIPNASYDAVLVVTNPNVTGANVHHAESAINLGSTIGPGVKFFISDAGQHGQISYSLTTNPTSVSYKLGTINPNQSLFMRDSDGYICATTQGEPLTPESKCSDASFVLSSNGSTGTVSLNIGRKSDLTDPNLAKWDYNKNGDNEWCIISGNGTNRRCMSYDVSFTNLVPASTSVSSSSTNNNNQPVAVSQPIFVVSGNGSKWVNTRFM